MNELAPSCRGAVSHTFIGMRHGMRPSDFGFQEMLTPGAAFSRHWKMVGPVFQALKNSASPFSKPWKPSAPRRRSHQNVAGAMIPRTQRYQHPGACSGARSGKGCGRGHLNVNGAVTPCSPHWRAVRLSRRSGGTKPDCAAVSTRTVCRNEAPTERFTHPSQGENQHSAVCPGSGWSRLGGTGVDSVRRSGQDLGHCVAVASFAGREDTPM
jgi:hypothetical protein